MGKILVTGGAGYIGSHVNKGLHAKGYETLVLDNLIYGHREFVKWGEFVCADLANIDQLRLVFKTYTIDAVMHFAAFAYVGESVVDPQKYYWNNVANTLNLLYVMLEFGVKIIVFSSSCATYGLPGEIPITEEHPQLPINPYGRSKLMVENILDDFADAYEFSYTALRYFNAAGADSDSEIGEWHEPETHLIPLLLDVARERKKKIQIFGTDYQTPDGTCIRDYIHVTDLAEAHILSLDYLLSGGASAAFNLGNGNGFSVKEVIKSAERVTSKRIRIDESSRRKGDPSILIGSSQKIKDVLGWQPRYENLDLIIETAWKWHQRNFS